MQVTAENMNSTQIAVREIQDKKSLNDSMALKPVSVMMAILRFFHETAGIDSFSATPSEFNRLV
jgi:hypothetical protein